MINPGALFDEYGRKARLYPSLLTGLPAVATAAAWVPAVSDVETSGPLVGVAAAAGLFYALASMTRSAGKRLQTRLLADWGGWPTTIMLRHRSTYLSGPTKARYHHFLSQSGAGVQLPTAAQEEQDPANANEAYGSAVEWLKEQRRGAAFNLILKENAEYGFRRNLLALKSIGIGLCVLSLVGWLVALLLTATTMPSDIQSAVALAARVTIGKWAALAFTVAMLFGWLLVVRDDWVREAGEHYAVALLASIDAPPGPNT